MNLHAIQIDDFLLAYYQFNWPSFNWRIHNNGLVEWQDRQGGGWVALDHDTAEGNFYTAEEWNENGRPGWSRT